jgi:hypothetical protein
MLRNHAILYAAAPAVAEPAPGGTAVEPAYAAPGSKSWISGLPSLTEPVEDAPAKPEPAKAARVAQPGDKPPEKPAAPEPDPAAKAEAEKQAATKAAEDKVGADAKAKADAEAAAKGSDEIDQEKMPRSTTDWEKYKGKYKGRTDELKKEIASRDTALKEAQSKLAEVEAKLTEKPAADPDLTDKLDRAVKLNKELSDRIAVLDVTKDPRFETYFNQKTDEVITEAKGIVGADKAEAIEKLLKMPDNEYRKAQIEAFMADLDTDDGTKTDLRVVIRDLRKINLEREGEIKKANEHKDKIIAERTQKGQQAKAQYEAAFDSEFAKAQDPKTGFAVYQKRTGEGSETWNAGVDKRKEGAKALLFSNSIPPSVTAKAALDAMALPVLLAAYQSDITSWKEEKARLETQVKELSAAQPGGGSGGGSPKDGGEKTYKVGERNPFQMGNDWSEKMSKLMRGE